MSVRDLFSDEPSPPDRPSSRNLSSRNLSHPSDEPQSEAQRVLSVYELTIQIKQVLESTFPSVWVTGEISDLARPRSGHCYLTLKDEQAQIRSVIWRSTMARLKFDLHDGLEVVCRGHVDVYAPRGSYQLIIDSVEPKGLGALELALRQLREKLTREGLFDPARKRPLPKFARRIAVVTSPTGAAIHDFLQVLGRRWRGTDVMVIPTRVQGEGAGEEIAGGVAVANEITPAPDVIVVTRGGGSLEDLWCFNEEIVVRAIHASRVPVVSAVGHEIDVTLSDLVADVRALTPSEAAELVAPAADELAAGLRQLGLRLSASLRHRATAARARLDAVANHAAFRRPHQRVYELARAVDDLQARADRAVRRQLQTSQNRHETLAARLESLSPLAVLGRGYSLTQRTSDGQLIRNAAELTPGEQITTRFARGAVVSRVEETDAE